VAEHVALLVAHAALDRRVDAEHVAHGLAQRLGAVEDDEHALLCVEAALDEVGQQRRRHRGVLGRAVPKPERMLDAVGVDAERDDTAAPLELDPVEHEHRQAQIAQGPRHEVDEVLARARDELAADGGLRLRARRALDVGPDRLARAPVAARGDPSEHALEHDGGERVALGEGRGTRWRAMRAACANSPARASWRTPCRGARASS
jgi:hypothetical protein